MKITAGSPMRTARAQVRLMVPTADGDVGPPVSHENSLWTWVSAGNAAITPPSHAGAPTPAAGQARGSRRLRRPPTGQGSGRERRPFYRGVHSRTVRGTPTPDGTRSTTSPQVQWRLR
ncbi:hypothetical protein GCM10022204_28390 [Microlunatus aurantiacus]|uniref:Uncharacterized protein n=1 Tax=Microlunatus aurantiacus TaxID=446786 RepID=A0ABP7DPU8_9ACTN